MTCIYFLDIPSYDGGARITNYNAQMKAAGDQGIGNCV